MAGGTMMPTSTGIQRFDISLEILADPTRSESMRRWAMQDLLREAARSRPEEQSTLASAVVGLDDECEESVAELIHALRLALPGVPGMPSHCGNLYGNSVPINEQ